ncbi:MAG: polysaccharide pyruvyl transferase family protein [bacterium]
MKIKTITCHDVYNYGASLQAYALQYYLKSLGHRVEIIDYLPRYISGKNYTFWFVSEQSPYYNICKKNVIIKFLYCMRRLIMYSQTFGRKKAFDQFKLEFLSCTNRYTTYQDLCTNPPEADFYIAGSDQIWNTSLGNGKDPSFYLQFGNDNIKRISYAASFGIAEIPEEMKPQIYNWLNRVNSISVREQSGLDILSNLNIDSAVEVVDPVFLLDKQEWGNLANTSTVRIEYPYILVYDMFMKETSLKTSAIKLSKKLGLPLVAINDAFKVKYADRSICDAGPAEFVSLIKNATVIISSSFHATAFSIIFEKEFYTFYKGDNISRMINILDKIGCVNRLNSPDVVGDMEKPDCKATSHLLSESINKSKKFLGDTLC